MNNIVINLNKPKHISSQDAVTKVKHFFRARRAGHAGTLDPIATGILIICLNEATKITRFLSDLDKEYIVLLKLGERTNTYDSTGKVIEKKICPSFEESYIQEVLKHFLGRIKQIPPMYSAIKVNGRPLYKFARMGLNIKRAERTVTIYNLELLSFQNPYIEIKVSCSKGTYIRTLCDDIGKFLGVGAHMASLERTRIGNFYIEEAAKFEELGTKQQAFHSADSAISHLDEIILDEYVANKAKNGIPIHINDNTILSTQYIRLKNQSNELIGIGKIEGDLIKIIRLLNIS